MADDFWTNTFGDGKTSFWDTPFGQGVGLIPTVAAVRGITGNGGYMDFLNPQKKPAPDYQGASNTQIGNNRPTQVTPDGSVQWTKDANGNWTQTTSLSPGNQGLHDQFTQQLSGAAGQDAWKRAFEAAYGQETSRLDPMWNQRESALQQQLANQGLDMNSEAGKGAYGNFNRGRNDAYASAFNNAFGLGQQAQAQNFTEGMAGLSGLHGLAAAPNFMGDNSTLPAAIAQGNYGLQQQQQQMQLWTDLLRGGATLGAAAL